MKICIAQTCRRYLTAAAAAGLALLAAPGQVAAQADPSSVAAPHSSRGPVSVLDVADLIVNQALEFLGIPYVWGGSDPQTGFDCSGLVQHVFLGSLGLELPRQAEAMSRVGRRIERRSLQAGDLIFFNTRGSTYSHVGIYLGSDRFIHAPSRRGYVRIESLSTPYWLTRYTGARRVFDFRSSLGVPRSAVVAPAGEQAAASPAAYPGHGRAALVR
jgi:cell wall-associated NlpC family hydrolase